MAREEGLGEGGRQAQPLTTYRYFKITHFSYRMLWRGFALCTWTSQIGQNLLVSRCRTMQLRQTATQTVYQLQWFVESDSCFRQHGRCGKIYSLNNITKIHSNTHKWTHFVDEPHSTEKRNWEKGCASTVFKIILIKDSQRWCEEKRMRSRTLVCSTCINSRTVTSG